MWNRPPHEVLHSAEAGCQGENLDGAHPLMTIIGLRSDSVTVAPCSSMNRRSSSRSCHVTTGVEWVFSTHRRSAVLLRTRTWRCAAEEGVSSQLSHGDAIHENLHVTPCDDEERRSRLALLHHDGPAPVPLRHEAPHETTVKFQSSAVTSRRAPTSPAIVTTFQQKDYTKWLNASNNPKSFPNRQGINTA